MEDVQRAAWTGGDEVLEGDGNRSVQVAVDIDAERIECCLPVHSWHVQFLKESLHTPVDRYHITTVLHTFSYECSGRSYLYELTF